MRRIDYEKRNMSAKVQAKYDTMISLENIHRGIAFRKVLAADR
jgi:hypothetical protein